MEKSHFRWTTFRGAGHIPFDVVEGNLSLNLTPRKGHKFAQYMEGWNLLRGAEKKARKKAAPRGLTVENC
jgi:hypothetical protein